MRFDHHRGLLRRMVRTVNQRAKFPVALCSSGRTRLLLVVRQKHWWKKPRGTVSPQRQMTLPAEYERPRIDDRAVGHRHRSGA